jgi:hypothetical protein
MKTEIEIKIEINRLENELKRTSFIQVFTRAAIHIQIQLLEWVLE